MPPETSMVVPVIQSASVEQAKETAAAMSVGISTRPSGVLPTMVADIPELLPVSPEQDTRAAQLRVFIDFMQARLER